MSSSRFFPVVMFLLLALLVLATVTIPSAPRTASSGTASPGLEDPSPGPNVSGANATAAAGAPSGAIRILVVATEFSDIPHQKSIDDIYDSYFGPGQSVSSYYREVSYGKLLITGKVVGWYTLPYKQAHYGTDCRAIDDTDCTGNDVSWNIAQDSAAWANKIVTLSDYDYFVFLHTGVGEESDRDKEKTAVWSVAYLAGVWVRPTQGNTGMTITQFDIVPEREAGGAVPLGVYVHEFGHLLGLPDLYDTFSGKTRNGVWELMDKGLWNGDPYGSLPAEMSTWDRLKLKWLSNSSITTLDPTSAGFVMINPLEYGKGTVAAKVQIKTSLYYLVEVRQPIGFDRGLPSYGIVAYVVDSSGGKIAIKAVDQEKAFAVGHLYQSTATMPAQVNFKVFARFANGSYLVGFGPSSFIRTATLTVNLAPAASNATVTVNGVSYATDDNGTVTVLDYSGNPTGFNVTVPDTASVSPGTREKFAQWSTGSTSRNLNLPGANATVTASYKTQHYVDVSSPYGTASGSGWYDRGSVAEVSITTPVNATQPGTRYAFTKWTGDYDGTASSAKIPVNSPLNLTAMWKTQYYFSVETGGHAAADGTGWYDAGSHAAFSLTAPKPANGTWYVFNGWTGSYTGQSTEGAVDVNGPARVTAVWNVFYWMTVRLVDTSGAQVAATRIGRANLVAPNGTTVQIPANSTGQWMLNGTYRVAEVDVFGANVAEPDQTVAAAPNGVIPVRLLLFDLTFTARDLITSAPVSGVNVSATMPDGTRESAVTGPDGMVVLKQLPASTYPYRVSGGWIVNADGAAQITSTGAAPIRVNLIFIPTLAGAAAATVAAFLGAFIAVQTGYFYAAVSKLRPHPRLRIGPRGRKRRKSRAAAILRGEIRVGPDGELVLPDDE